MDEGQIRRWAMRVSIRKTRTRCPDLAMAITSRPLPTMPAEPNRAHILLGWGLNHLEQRCIGVTVCHRGCL